MNAHLLVRSYPVARWLPLFAALLSALLLFAGQQLVGEIRDARADAREDADTLLEIARLARLIHAPGALRSALEEETRRFSHADRVDYCDRTGCLTVARLAGAAACDGTWHWRSMCVQVASPDDAREQVTLRYSLDREHLGTARDLSLLAVILLVATLVGALSTHRLLARAAAAERQLRHAGEHDALTGLPNRAKFETAVSRQLTNSINRKAGEHALLLFMHFDGVKPAIDQFGHHAGDLLLIDAARRLQALAGPSDVVARLQGAAFAVMVVKEAMADDTPDVEAIADRWLTSSIDRSMADGATLVAGVTVGAARLAPDVTSAGEALRRADVALHEAQRGGRQRLVHFDPAMDRAAQVRYDLQAALKLGIGGDEFYLEYQPQVAPTGELRGIEALARWRHPVRGPVRPDEFIPVAESAGLIGTLGLRVLELACADVVRARAQGLHLPYVSVNVSPGQLSDPGLEDAFLRVLSRHALTPRDIELEVTESSLMESCDCDAVIHRFAQAGFRIAIDDFGTGYSSLSRLHSLPVHKLKIDRSFVMQLGLDGRGTAIVQSIMDLAQRLDLKTVAEGVETAEQAAWLRDAGCSLLQGYLYARPMPFDRLMSWAGDMAPATEPGVPTWAETAPVGM